ncbi:MAG: zf-HC2 domain-containing protein [Acidobacteriota bacterium]|jgi:hypothetical protein|nr:zf-HC2 domain-containing protein [Acidobacteriota bacterium]
MHTDSTNMQEHADEGFCGELLADLICYELQRGHLSPEMKYLLERHLAQCPDCRRRIYGFLNMLSEETAMHDFC